jgi:hypothetical protein
MFKGMNQFGCIEDLQGKLSLRTIGGWGEGRDVIKPMSMGTVNMEFGNKMFDVIDYSITVT